MCLSCAVGCFSGLADPCLPGPPVLAVQRIAESHLQSISNLGENQASEEEDELGELRELGYPREEEEEDVLAGGFGSLHTPGLQEEEDQCPGLLLPSHDLPVGYRVKWV